MKFVPRKSASGIEIPFGRRVILASALAMSLLLSGAGNAVRPSLGESTAEQTYEADSVEAASSSGTRQLYSGQVVLLGDALRKRGIEVAEEMADQAVLQTEAGELIPLLADWRGRAFFQDERLRNRKVELVGRRTADLPYLRVLMVFTFDEEGERQYTDYWCDICSIPMYEMKPCDCCQGEIRLRFQLKDLPDYLNRDKSAP